MIRLVAFAPVAVAATFAAIPAVAAPEAYVLDSSHSQIVFSYDHLGYSTGYGMFGGFAGDISFDAEDPAASTVSVTIPVTSMLTGWDARFQHFMSPDFFDAAANPDVTFASTAIEVTGEDTALITGDLTMNGMTKPVVLDAVLNQASEHPMEGKPWMGLSATTTLLRSDFGLEMFTPFIGDEVQVMLSIEAMKAE